VPGTTNSQDTGVGEWVPIIPQKNQDYDYLVTLSKDGFMRRYFVLHLTVIDWKGRNLSDDTGRFEVSVA
jgi:hypothetical protein